MKYYKLITIVSAIICFNTLLLGFIFDTPILKFMVKSQKALKPGNEMRDFYLNLPIPLDFRVYFFNITNPLEVQQGKYPIVQEIGPYCYDAYKEKINVIDDDAEDTLTYSPHEPYFFNQTRSGDLTQDDYVTILNPLIVGMINFVADSKPSYLSTLNKALKAIFKESNNIYLTAKVRDILFDGVEINCTVKDFAARIVCSQIKNQASIIEKDKDLYLFSLLGSRNGTIDRRMKVQRGKKDANDIGRVVSIDNQTSLVVWPEEKCNTFHGTDGWIFPSFLNPEDGIWSVAPELCRSIQAKFVENDKYQSLNVRKYYASFEVSSSEEKCYCITPEKCPPKGVMDLTNCMKVPLYVTLPHFLQVDEEIQKKVQGLNPDINKHINTILFEPMTGTPVVGHRRIQFNLNLQPLEKITIMNAVPEVLHPILWIEDGVELDGFLLKKITDVFLILKIITGVKYIFLIAGVEGLIYGGYKIYKNSKKNQVFEVVNKSKSPSAASKNSTQPNGVSTILQNVTLSGNGIVDRASKEDGVGKF